MISHYIALVMCGVESSEDWKAAFGYFELASQYSVR